MSSQLKTPRQSRPGCRNLLALSGLLLVCAACGGDHPDHATALRGDTPGAPRQETPQGRSRPGTLSGRLTDRRTGLALAGATVHAQDARKPRILARAITASDGSYTLSGLPLGVPLRVVTQPVTGAVAYGAELSQQVTLVQGVPAPALDLACTQAAWTGAVEIARHHRNGRATEIALVQQRDTGAGNILKLVLRTAETGADGALRFESVPAGQYEVHFLTRGRPRQQPRRDRRPRAHPVAAANVRAGETAHVNWPAQLFSGDTAADAVEDPDAPSD